MTQEEMQKQIESMMPTPQQIVEHIDKELEEKRKAIGKLAELIEAFNDLPCEEKIRKISDTRVKMEKEVWLDKACEWLKENKDHPFIGCEDSCLSGYLTDEFIGEFKKAMEE